jgi:hypothetical protein
MLSAVLRRLNDFNSTVEATVSNAKGGGAAPSLASFVGTLVSMLSGSGRLLMLAADLRALIQLLRMPWVTAERMYSLSSRVATTKP